jgi:hypothetical protein
VAVAVLPESVAVHLPTDSPVPMVTIMQAATEVVEVDLTLLPHQQQAKEGVAELVVGVVVVVVAAIPVTVELADMAATDTAWLLAGKFL